MIKASGEKTKTTASSGNNELRKIITVYLSKLPRAKASREAAAASTRTTKTISKYSHKILTNIQTKRNNFPLLFLLIASLSKAENLKGTGQIVSV